MKIHARPERGKVSLDVREPGPSALTIGDVVKAAFLDECLVPNVDVEGCPCSLCAAICKRDMRALDGGSR